jgi:hypothetical protein
MAQNQSETWMGLVLHIFLQLKVLKFTTITAQFNAHAHAYERIAASFELHCCVRGHHVCKHIWSLVLGGDLECADSSISLELPEKVGRHSTSKPSWSKSEEYSETFLQRTRLGQEKVVF